jgi:hypothetical protein
MKFFRSILLDVVQVALAVLWLRHGEDGAGNALLAINWTTSVFRLWIALASIDDGLKPHPGGAVWDAYNWLRFGVKFLFLAWIAHFWLMGVYVASCLFVAAAVHQYKVKQSQASA